MLTYLCCLVLWQSDQPTIYRDPYVSDPSYPAFIQVDLSELAPPPGWRPGDPIKEIPRGHGELVNAPAPETHSDPLLQRQQQAPVLADPTFGIPILNFNAQPFGGINPPDTVGDVGTNYYIQAINQSGGNGGTVYTIYNKSDGSVAAGPFLMTSFAPCSGRGDPIVLFDGRANRWLLAEFGPAGQNRLCVLVSASSDPIAGGWFQYSFAFPANPDYPKFGVWNDAITLTTNEAGPSPVYAFNRADLLTGAPTQYQRLSVPDLSGFGFNALTPADMDGDPPPAAAPALFMRHRDDEMHNPGMNNPAEDYVELYEMDIDWVTPANTTLTGPFNIATSEFNSAICPGTPFNCFPQPGTTTRLDALREIIMFRLQYRNFGTHQSLVGNFVVDVDGSNHGGIRWFELRSGGASWSLHQEGTYAPDNHHRWVGAIAMDQEGNLALAYNVTSTTIFPSLRYAGRLAGDPLGMLPEGEHDLATGLAAHTSTRYGDYAQMSVDPDDGCTFWFTGMYNPSPMFQTRIASFRFDSCICTAEAPSGLSAAANGPNQIDLSWSAAPMASSYNVYRSLASCPTSPAELLASGVLTTTYSDTSVSGMGTYAYFVTTVGGSPVCESPLSDCAEATATGSCFLNPDFDGLQSVQNATSPECSLNLSWQAGQAACGTGLVYNIYRSTDALFVPSGATLIESCWPSTTYQDTGLGSGVAYTYVVRAEDTTGNGAGLCALGNEDTNTVRVTGTASGPVSVPFSDDMEAGDTAWTLTTGPANTPGSLPWSLTTAQSQSPTHAWTCPGPVVITDHRLETLQSFVVPIESVLSFAHRVELEMSFDGAVLEYSSDGGSNWHDILEGDGVSIPTNAGRFIEGPYNSVVIGAANPILGRSSWSGDNFAFQTVQVDLSDFAGAAVSFRWRIATDDSGAGPGWTVDDVAITQIRSCGCPVSISYWPLYTVNHYVHCLNTAP